MLSFRYTLAEYTECQSPKGWEYISFKRKFIVPTINQLVRKPRHTAKKASKSPALGRIQNALKVRYYNQDAPLKRGVCVKVTTKTPK